MEMLLAQENRSSEGCVQSQNLSGGNNSSMLSPGSLGTGGSKRNSLKRWIHGTVLGYDVDDNFDNDDTVVIEEDDDIVFVPNLSEMSNGLFSVNKELLPLLFEQKPERKSYRRQKLKDFKLHLKMKIHLARGEANGLPYKLHGSVGQENSGGSDNYNGEALECYRMFRTQPEHLDTLFDYTMKSALNPVSPSKSVDFNDDGILAKEMQLFQNLKYHDINSILEPVAFSPPRVWDTDKQIDLKNSEAADGSGICSSNSNDSKGGEECPTLSMDSTEIESCTTGDSPEESCDLTPSVYLANELTTKDGAAVSHSSNDSFTSAEVEETSYEDSQDTQNTLCSSGSPDINSESDSGSDSSDSNTIIYKIPTFKQGRGKLNVSGVVQSLKNGTLTEENLNRIAKSGFLGISFRSKEFYDQPPSSSEDANEQIQECEQEVPVFSSENDGIETGGIEFAGNGEAVKFDRYSQILVYRVTKRNVRNKEFNDSTLKLSNKGNGTITSKASEPLCGSKSILKKTGNEREPEETTRATLCDKVDVKSFLSYFEYFEHQKHSEEINLGKVREQQLNRYYSKEFFPELLEDTKFKHTFNGEYTKSKMATEVNIGRKIDNGSEQCVRRLINVKEDPRIGSTTLKQ
ncbi:hypothetical protein ZYGM_002397 [Zygosaccharomyces mellis]|uniref:Uncharacterized protein n=1 Tax=Zygosaccharomyces mellis TaxID=42258 RepID=A0A4C2E6T0_9SACH|nr:hypothetical protein ZYGM_002397 [Zygosaccharomyces mellis]